jgi:hypothetical protein
VPESIQAPGTKDRGKSARLGTEFVVLTYRYKVQSARQIQTLKVETHNTMPCAHRRQAFELGGAPSQRYTNATISHCSSTTALGLSVLSSYGCSGVVSRPEGRSSMQVRSSRALVDPHGAPRSRGRASAATCSVHFFAAFFGRRLHTVPFRCEHTHSR